MFPSGEVESVLGGGAASEVESVFGGEIYKVVICFRGLVSFCFLVF